VSNRLGLLDGLVGLDKDELDVAGVGHVRVDLPMLLEMAQVCWGLSKTYTAVSAVCTPSLLGGLVDLDVLDDQVAGVETLGVGVGLSVLEQAKDELGALDGPAGPGDTESLACVHVSPVHALNNHPQRIPLGYSTFRHGEESHSFPTLSHHPKERFAATHPARCGRCHQRTASWERPPCAQ
jgi:hypothetical protein